MVLNDSWTQRAEKHAELLSPFIDSFLRRRNFGQPHPVHDFLFTYYTCSPQKLKQWVPPFNEPILLDSQSRELFPWLNDYWFYICDDLLYHRKERFHPGAVKQTKFIKELCDNILNRAPRFGCFGMHEWAMVYRSSQDDIRHSSFKMRLTPQEIASFVEKQTICCTHYDAYRFFTKEAAPLNTLNPTFDRRLEMEQSGCVHANMDLYKWATKLWPWIGSDFIRETFFLALEARELDMRASPYDLEKEGYLPIKIETEEGKIEYRMEQEKLTLKANALRKKLSLFCDELLQF